VTLTPTFWASLTIIPFDSLGPSQSKRVASEDGAPVKPSGSSDESVNVKTPLSRSADLPQVKHKRFFFEDGNVTFLVEGVLYRLHRYLFCRHSNELKDRLSVTRLPDDSEEESSSPQVIPLDDVKSADFDALLSILYPQNYNKLYPRSFKEWTSILELSTRWGFTSIRDLAIRCANVPSSLQRLVAARKYDIEGWVVPALLGLCERPEPLTLNEARLLGVEDVVLVGTVRQSVRSSDLTVQGVGIGDHIRAWKDKLERVPSPVSDPPGTPQSPTSPGTPPPSGGLSHGQWGFGISSGFAQTPLYTGTVNSFAGGDLWATSKKKKGKKK